MALAPETEPRPVRVDATATREDGWWRIDVARRPSLSLRVRSLDEVDAAVRRAMAQRTGVTEAAVVVDISVYRATAR